MNALLFLILSTFPSSQGATKCDANSFIQSIVLPNQETVDLELVSAKIRTMDKHLIADTQKGKQFSYWVDLSNQVHFTSPKKVSDIESFLVLKNAKSKDGFMIKETGTFYYDPKLKKYTFKQKKSMDLEPGEIDQAIREQTNLEYTRQADPRFDQARVMHCAEVLSSRQRADNFFRDAVISSAVVTTASFFTVDALHPSDRTFEEKMRLLGSDLASNLTVSAVSSFAIKPLITKDVNIVTDFAIRTGLDYGTGKFIKKPIYNALNPLSKEEEKNKKTMGEVMLPYDMGFGMVRFLPKRMLEKASINYIPRLMMNACLKNSAMNFIIGPRSVRMVDRYMWGLFYQAGREVYMRNGAEKEYTNQVNKEKSK